MEELVVDYVMRAAALVHKLLPVKIVLSSVLWAFGYALIACLIELPWAGFRRSAIRKLFYRPSVSAWTDIASFLASSSGITPLLGLALTFATLWSATGSIRPLITLELAANLPPLYHALLLLVVFDFLDYWLHRWGHENTALWQLHRFHHSATEMTVLTPSRNHPVEGVIKVAIFGVVGAILGAAPFELFGVLAVRAVFSGLKHSEVQWRWGWFGKYVLQSPHGHSIHHSTDPSHFNTNYATLFSIWDVWFGTYRDCDERIERIGLDDDELNSRHFVHDLWVCYAAFLKEFARAIKAGATWILKYRLQSARS